MADNIHAKYLNSKKGNIFFRKFYKKTLREFGQANWAQNHLTMNIILDNI